MLCRIECFNLIFLQPGDFVLFVNMRSLKAKVSTADTLIKVPGKGQQYGRGIYKLIENSADNYPEVNAAIQ